MSDVVAAAVIAALLGIAGNGVTAFVTLRVTARQTRADADRLFAEHAEADRRGRREAYAQMLNVLERLDLMFSTYAIESSTEDLDAWLREFRAAAVAVSLVESEVISTRRAELARLLDRLALDIDRRVQAESSMAEAFAVSYVAVHDDFTAAGHALGRAMRDDLGF